MVFDDGQVENRLMRRAGRRDALGAGRRRRTSSTPACAAARWPRPASRSAAELERARRELDAASARLVEEGLAAWGGGGESGRALIVRGRANLLGDPQTLADLERVRMLFDDLEQKEQLIGLLDLVRDAEGVRIFIGAETQAVLAFGFRRDRGALYERQTEGAGRDRRDRSGPAELCPGDPAGRLHGAGARAHHGWMRRPG